MSNLTLAIILVFVLGVIFRKKIIEEYNLISRQDAKVLIDDQILSFFVPHSSQERIESLQEHVAEFTQIQNRVDRSWIAKYFIDYKELIAKGQEDLQARIQLEEESPSDCLSFSTYQLIHVNANPHFKFEQLLDIGAVLDEGFSESELEVGMVNVDYVEEKPFLSLGISLDELNEEHKHVFQTVINTISHEIFESKPIQLQVECWGDLDSQTENVQYFNFTSTEACVQ